MGNSLKFTEQGGVYINVKVVQSLPRLKIEFNVTDTGIGIPKEKQRSLFQAFTQVDSSTTRKYGGTGLGLQISQRLVELMNGKIDVQSQPGKGSSFIFSIDLDAGEKPSVAKASAHISQHPASDVRVLVAEDNRTNQIVIGAMLTKLGYTFDLFENGKEAIQSLNNNAYDLILMDCQMPVLDGLEATKEIRKSPQWKDLPIVALTAGATDKEQSECTSAGMNDFLSKPITIDVLENTLKKWH